MKLLTTAYSLSLLLIVAACNDAGSKAEADAKPAEDSSTTKIAEAPAAEAGAPVDSATMMKNWQAYMTPGEPHKMMAKMNGTWNGDITMWMSPGAPPTKNTGVAVYKTILNGLYQESVHKGNMMGQPFEGHSITAYDNHKKIFESIWVDNMGSGIMHLTGPWDEASKSITLTGKIVDPTTGKDCNVREVMKMTDDNTQVMEMYMTGPDGKEFKTMEIISKRGK